jgi:transcriptional antiterminator RfaH
MAFNWYVIRSKSNKEEFLARQLDSRGVEFYYPHLRVNPINPRSRTEKPYFPGYLFLHTDLQVNPPVLFERIPGAIRLVHIGGEAARVPENIVHAIQTRVEEINAAGGTLMKGLQPGDKVIIEKGPFEGYEGILDVAISGTERVRVLLRMLQARQVPVELPASYINSRRKRE